MRELNSLVPEVSDVGDEHAGAVQQEVTVLAPWGGQVARAQAGTQLDGIRSCSRGAADMVEVDEGRPGERSPCCSRAGGLWGHVGVAAGQGVRHSVEATRAELNSEVETEKLADPLVLRDR